MSTASKETNVVEAGEFLSESSDIKSFFNFKLRIPETNIVDINKTFSLNRRDYEIVLNLKFKNNHFYVVDPALPANKNCPFQITVQIVKLSVPELKDFQFGCCLKIVNTSLSISTVINSGYLTGEKMYEKMTIIDISHNIRIHEDNDLILNVDILQMNTISYSPIDKDFETLLKCTEFSDIVFKVGDKEFKAHKSILAARSQVFFKMFKNDMQEKDCKSIEIKKIDPDVFENLLYFLYTGRTKNFDYRRMSDLLVAANYYCIEGLEKICEFYILKYLNIDNALENLIIADLISSNEFKMKIMDYIMKNKDGVLKTDGYNNLEKNHAHLILEMFRRINVENRIMY